MAEPYATPDDVEFARRFGGNLMQRGTDASPVGHWTQALARALQGGVGSMWTSGASMDERAGREGGQQAIQSALKTNDPMKLAALSSNPWIGQQGMQLGQMMQSRQQAGQQQAWQRENAAAGRQHSEKMLDLQNQYGLKMMQAKDVMEVERLKTRARALGLDVDGQGAPGGAPAAAPGSAPAPLAPAVGNPAPAPAAPAPDIYGRLVEPARDPATVEADRKKRAAQSMLVGDEKGAIKILNKDEDPKEYQTKDASWSERMARAEISLRGEVGSPSAPKYNPGDIRNKLWPDDSVFNGQQWRSYQGAAREWISALLRKDTGAAVTQAEWDLYFPTYFATPGDSPQVQQQKLERRVATARGLRAGSGPAFDRMYPGFDQEMRQRLQDQNQGPPRPAGASPAAVARGRYVFNPETREIEPEGGAPTADRRKPIRPKAMPE